MPRNPRFTKAGPDLWRWGDWWIARVPDGYRLLTPSGDDLGPFMVFDHALVQAQLLA